MSQLMRTSEVAKLPVVTLAGDDVAQIKDVVYASDGGAVVGFTLAGRGIFAGPSKHALLWSKVTGLGPDAVMIAHADVLDSTAEVAEAAATDSGSRKGGNVLGNRVLTDAGTDLGEVVDVVMSFVNGTGGVCDVVGYEIEASESLSSKASNAAKGTRLLIPLPDTLAVSGKHLMVPSEAEAFVTDDFAGFGAAVTEFRSQLEGRA